MHGLKQLIESPTNVTCSTSILIDHILAIFPSRVSQKGVIDVGISDHQLTFCTRKISHLKTGGIHKYLNFRSFKNYTVDFYKEALKQLDFPNYESFDDVNSAYSKVFQKILTVIDKVALYRNKQIKGNIQKWCIGARTPSRPQIWSMLGNCSRKHLSELRAHLKHAFQISGDNRKIIWS